MILSMLLMSLSLKPKSISLIRSAEETGTLTLIQEILFHLISVNFVLEVNNEVHMKCKTSKTVLQQSLNQFLFSTVNQYEMFTPLL